MKRLKEYISDLAKSDEDRGAGVTRTTAPTPPREADVRPARCSAPAPGRRARSVIGRTGRHVHQPQRYIPHRSEIGSLFGGARSEADGSIPTTGRLSWMIAPRAFRPLTPPVAHVSSARVCRNGET